jgi:hypothetical protein
MLPDSDTTLLGLGLLLTMIPRDVTGVHFAKVVPRDVFQAGLMGDAGGFGRVFFGIAVFLAVVFLPDPLDGGDGEESSVCTNLTTVSHVQAFHSSPVWVPRMASLIYHR